MPQRGQILWNGRVLRFELFVLRRILLVPPTPNGITLKNAVFHSIMNINSSSICDDDLFQMIIEKHEDIVAAIFPTLLGRDGARLSVITISVNLAAFRRLILFNNG